MNTPHKLVHYTTKVVTFTRMVIVILKLSCGWWIVSGMFVFKHIPSTYLSLFLILITTLREILYHWGQLEQVLG